MEREAGLRDITIQSRPTFILDNERLIERYEHVTYFYGRWDATFGASCHDGVGRYEFLPTFDLVDSTGDFATTYGPAVTSEDDDELDQDRTRFLITEHQPGCKSGVCAETNLSVCIQYVQLIPLDLRQTIAKLRQFQWPALEACWHIPEFAPYLISSIANFGPNLITLIYSLAKPFERPQSWRLHVARRVMSASPRVCLSWLLGATVAKGAGHLVSKLERIPKSPPFWSALYKLLSSQTKIDLLLGQTTVPIRCLPKLASWPDWLWTGKLIGLVCAFKGDEDARLDPYTLKALDELVVGEARRAKLRSYLEAAPTPKTLGQTAGNRDQ